MCPCMGIIKIYRPWEFGKGSLGGRELRKKAQEAWIKKEFQEKNDLI